MKRNLPIIIVFAMFISSCLMEKQSFTMYCSQSPQVVGFNTQTPVSFIFGQNNLYYSTSDALQDIYRDKYYIKIQDAIDINPVWGDDFLGSISPDRKWIVYSKPTSDITNSSPDRRLEYYLVGWDGKSLLDEGGGRKIVDATANWDFSGWINKDLLLFRHVSTNKSYAADQLIFLNPFTGEKKEYSFDIKKNNDSKGMVKINSAGTYLAYIDNWETDSKIHIVELATGKEKIIQITPIYSAVYFASVSWSPDGTQFAVYMEKLDDARNPDTGLGLYIVKTNGKATRVVDLSTQKEYNDYSIINVEWSPDGQHIAFGVTTQNRQMAAHVYDLENNKIIQLCYDFMAFERIWSDDGHYLLAHKPYIADDSSGLDWVLIDVRSWNTWSFPHTSRLSPRRIWETTK